VSCPFPINTLNQAGIVLVLDCELDCACERRTAHFRCRGLEVFFENSGEARWVVTELLARSYWAKCILVTSHSLTPPT